MAALANKSSLFSFHPTTEGFVPFFTIGGNVAHLPSPKYPISAVYIRISPDPSVVKQQINDEIKSMPIRVQISHANIREYISHRKSSIEWKFEEIDVTDLLRFFDEKFPKRYTPYTYGDIVDNIDLFPPYELTLQELTEILSWYQKMNREYTQQKPFLLFKTFDSRIMHLTGMFDYMSLHGGSKCLIRDPNDMYSYSLPQWYSQIPPTHYTTPFAFLELVDLHPIGIWYDKHVV